MPCMGPHELPDAARRASLGLVVGLLAIASNACTSGSSLRSSDTPSGPIRVVAAENLYGDIVAQIGGSRVTVTSILSDPNADPHLFEPGTTTGAAVADAQLVIENGLGYDSFMQRLLDASPDANRKVITVADVLHITASDANPHLWYDLPRIPQVASAIGTSLAALDPAGASYFRARVAAFDSSLTPIDDAIAKIKANYADAPVAYTEPVPGYLLMAAHLRVLTPASFALAIEEGNEPTPQDVAAMQDLFTSSQVSVLLYNSQATSPITEQLLALARRTSVPVVPVTETLPPGMSFQSWQLGQIRALAGALGG
ncbi:MAG: zinc/manganese transport system substrate-binding protein [Actinomycetota bacterium]|nr:zinc/manganese transport system substrate-binding protein [Actinomycetota bacterium]